MVRRRLILKAKDVYGNGTRCQYVSISKLREIAVMLGYSRLERSKKKLCDFIRKKLVKEKSFRERKEDALAHIPGPWSQDRCIEKGYRKKDLIAAAEHLGIPDSQIQLAQRMRGSSGLCAILQKYGIDKNNQPANVTPPARSPGGPIVPPFAPARVSPPRDFLRVTPPARVSPPRAQGRNVHELLHRQDLKRRFENEHKKRACQKKTRTNPEPYSTNQLRSILKREYGFSDNHIRRHLADKFGGRIFLLSRIDDPSFNKYKYRTELCKMAQIYFDTGVRPNVPFDVQRVVNAARRGNVNEARRIALQAGGRVDALSPTSQRKIDNLEASLPRDHPAIRATNGIMKRAWLKLQLGMRLTDTEKRAQRTQVFDGLAQRAMQFNLDRMMQQQMNEPEIRTVGLNDPGNNWSPAVGNNVNDVMNTAENDIFLAGNIPNANKAVYLKNNVQNKKIQAVYNQVGIKTWLMKKKSSPYTSKEIESWNSVKRVPEKIMRRHGDIVYWGIQDAEELQKIHKTKYVGRLLKLFKVAKTLKNFRTNVRNAAHVHDEQQYQNLRKSCATYMTMLKDYVMSKKTNNEKKGVLERIDKRDPACVENLCSAISEFIQEDSNEFVFDFDPELDKLTNVSNCANALRKSYCVMLKKKEIDSSVFIKKMKGLYQSIFNNLRNKVATDGEIGPSDVRKFLRDYGEMLLECPGMNLPKKLFKGFQFVYTLGGAL
tara:strand:- start:12749 stop:14890 length:2142 start_codon:yes stop_codon:yes gene_type:complete